MKRSTLILTAIFACAATAAFAQQGAQQPAANGANGAAARQPAPQPAPLFFREPWKNAPGNVQVTQDYVTNPDLKLDTFGMSSEGGVTSEGDQPHIWTGLCANGCGLVLSSKTNYVDLSGKAKIKWLAKTSGFHEIRPLLKLADGSYVIGDHFDADTVDFHTYEVYISEVHWMKIDVPKMQTRGLMLDKVDLSKVDAVGFADLTQGSGHGNGGYADLGWIEVYGKPVPRGTTTSQLNN